MRKIFKETNYYTIPQSHIFNETDNHKNICPKCNHYLVDSIIPCPDNFGNKCKDIHNGFFCSACHSYFQEVEDWSEFWILRDD